METLQNRKQTVPKEPREKLSKARQGRKLPEETKQKLREAARARYGNPVKRFWSKVDKSSGEDACWIWTAHINERSYGTVTWKGKNQRSNRVAWEIAHGEIPEGMHVLHKCDNKRCVNPDHLFLGTQADNMKDMRAKGREYFSKGEEHYKTSLTEDGVREIRRLASQKVSTRKIAERFGVVAQQVNHIIHRRSWKHIP